MKKITSFFLLLLALTFIHSCKEEKKPDHLLSQEKMTDLMLDLTILNSTKSLVNPQDTIVIMQTPEHILKKYGIDSLQFLEQHQYYATHETIYAAIFDSIHQRLEKQIKTIEDKGVDPRDEIKMDNKNIKLSRALDAINLPATEKKQP